MIYLSIPLLCILFSGCFNQKAKYPEELHQLHQNIWDNILDEEIDHVHKGDKWFKYLCEKEGLEESVYFDILERYKLLSKHRPHINVDARKEAGFTCGEIKKLGAKVCDE